MEIPYTLGFIHQVMEYSIAQYIPIIVKQSLLSSVPEKVAKNRCTLFLQDSRTELAVMIKR